jgi:hypothetical protein
MNILTIRDNYYLEAEQDAYAAAIWTMSVDYSDLVSLLQPLQDTGVLNSYDANFRGGQASVSMTLDSVYVNNLAPLVIGIGVEVVVGPVESTIILAGAINAIRNIIEQIAGPKIIPDNCPPEKREATPDNRVTIFA